MITVRQIQEATTVYFGLWPGDMTRKCRRRIISRPRQIAMYIAHCLTQHSTASIGRAFRRDHTTVLHAINLIHEMRKSNWYIAEHDDHVRDAIDHIMEELKCLNQTPSASAAATLPVAATMQRPAI